jgi:hypothetical protein
MTRSQQPALTLFAVGMIGLGILALVHGDFALVWQPVAPWIPGRTVLAYASGLIMLFGGVGLLFFWPEDGFCLPLWLGCARDRC